jgi:hypothetical protein
MQLIERAFEAALGGEMFCPKCGSQTVDGQKFCKACGTNIQLINDAIKGGSQGPFGIDVDALTRNAKEFAESWKKNWHPKVVGMRIDQQRVDSIRSEREARRKERAELRRQNLPKPKEYMSYSWQHNLRNGLVSLFWGTGLGIVLYYLGQTAINEGLIKQLEESSNGHVHGLEPLVRMIWLIALLPVLKGLAKIIYAAFFGESMATLTERFTPQQALQEAPPSIRQDTAPVSQPEPVRAYDPSGEPPPSVTEHTTHFFDETQPQARRETQ